MSRLAPDGLRSNSTLALKALTGFEVFLVGNVSAKAKCRAALNPQGGF